MWKTVLFSIVSLLLRPPPAAASEPSSGGAPPDLLILAPEPDTPVQGGRQVIALSLFDPDGDVDPSSIRLQVDGRDVTRRADLSVPLITYTPDRPFSPGPHRISIQAADLAGNRSGPLTWTFTVQRPRPRPFNLRGNLQVGIQYDRPSRPLPNRPRWDNQIRLDLNGTQQGVRWNGRLYLTSQETPFLTTERPPKGQPLNRYSLTARTRWLQITLGDAHPMWDELGLRGLLVRGIHTALYWGPVQVSWIRGLTRRAIDPTLHDEVAPDSVSAVRLEHPGSFRRNITAARVGLQVGERLDLSLHLLQAEDDTNSVRIPRDVRTQYRPKENLGVILRSALYFNRRRSVLTAEVGETILTDNLFSTLSDTALTEDLEQIPAFVKRLIQINASTRTTLDLSDPSDLSRNFVPRVYILRLQTPLPLHDRVYSHVHAELYRVPPNYASLGSPQQQNDVQGLRWNTHSRLWRGQLIADLGYDRYEDNVDESQLHTTTTRTTAAQITLTPMRWPQIAPSANVGLRFYRQKSLTQFNTSRTVTLSVNGKLHTAHLLHQVYLNGMHLVYRDHRSPADFDISALSLTLRTAFPAPLFLSATAGFTANRDRAQDITTTVRVLTLKAAYALQQNRLNVHGRFAALTNSNAISADDRAVDTARYTFSMGADYRLSAVHRVQAQWAWTRFTDRTDAAKNYTEPRLELNYRYRF